MIVICSLIHFYIITFWKVKKENLLRFIYFLLIIWFHRLQVFEQLIRSFNVVNFSKICSNISVKITSMLQKSNEISFVGQILKKWAFNSCIQNVLQFLPFCKLFLLLLFQNQNKNNRQGFVTILRPTVGKNPDSQIEFSVLTNTHFVINNVFSC